MDFRAIELAAAGELAPSNLSATGRRHLSRFVNGLGLDLVSLTADLPGLRLSDPRTVDERVARTEQALELAAELKVPVVTAAVGALTHPETGEPSPAAIEALGQIGEYGDRRGTIYALRPTRETGQRLVRVLDALSCPSIGVCLDPAAAVMCGANPIAEIEAWAAQVALFHARDGTAGLGERHGSETRLGEGEVDLVGVLEVLEAVDYHRPYILRQHDSATPAADLQHAREWLRRSLPRGPS
jgi:sugar phosphate isomerase/epimerase